MEKITAYQIEDGRIFSSEEEALKRESRKTFGDWYFKEENGGVRPNMPKSLDSLPEWLIVSQPKVIAFLNAYKEEEMKCFDCGGFVLKSLLKEPAEGIFTCSYCAKIRTDKVEGFVQCHECTRVVHIGNCLQLEGIGDKEYTCSKCVEICIECEKEKPVSEFCVDEEGIGLCNDCDRELNPTM